MTPEDFLKYLKPVAPEKASPPNTEHLQEWAESQVTPMLRQIAHKIVNNINYIPFQSFIAQLKETIADFHAQVSDKPYVIVMAEDRLEKLYEEGCSDVWVTGHALEYMNENNLRCPEAILDLTNFERYLEENAHIQDVLVLDDAAYSGNQKATSMTQFFRQCEDSNLTVRNINVYMGITYMSSHAKQNIQNLGVAENMHVLAHGHIPSIMDAFDETEKRYIESFRQDTSSLLFIYQAMTLTYFDHSFPDFQSTFSPMYEGQNLLSGMHISGIMGLMGQQVGEQPTQEQIDEYNNKVSEFLPNRGIVTGYTIPRIIRPYDKREQVELPAPPTTNPFKATTMPLEKQENYDSWWLPKETKRSSSPISDLSVFRRGLKSLPKDTTDSDDDIFDFTSDRLSEETPNP